MGEVAIVCPKKDAQQLFVFPLFGMIKRFTNLEHPEVYIYTFKYIIKYINQYIYISYYKKIECYSMHTTHPHTVLLVLVVQAFVVPALQINSSTSTTNILEVLQLPTPTKGRSVLGITVG